MSYWCLWLLCFQDPSDIREQLNVTYRQVQVRVQDRQGRPIQKLGANDFVLEVNGKEVAPQSFMEIGVGDAGSAAAVEATPVTGDTGVTSKPDPTTPAPVDSGSVQALSPQRSVAILLDPGMASVKGFQTLQQSALDLIDHLPANTRIAVYQMRYGLTTLSALSSDREMLRRSVTDAVYFAGLLNRLETSQMAIIREVEDMLTPRFSEKGGSTRVDAALNNLKGLLSDKGHHKDGYANKLAFGLELIGRMLVPQSGERCIYLLTAGGYSDSENRGPLRAVASRLNWNNIPIHTMHLRDRNAQALSQVSGSHLSELDLQAVQNSLSGKLSTQRNVNTLAESEEVLQTSSRTWAQETGGSFVNVNNPMELSEKLARLQQASDHYYLISYAASDKLDKVEIRLAAGRDAWDLRFGALRGVLSSAGSATSSEKATDFAATLMYGFPHRDTEIEWSFQHFRRIDGTFVFPVLGHLDGPFPSGGYELGMVALDQQGRILDERKSEIRKPGAGSVLEFYDLLATRVAPAAVRVMIREKQTGKSSLEEWSLEDQGLDGTGLSSLVLVPSDQRDLFAIHVLNHDDVTLDAKKIAREQLDPLIKTEGKRVGMTYGPFPIGKPLGLYFQAQRLEGGLNQYELESVLIRGEQRKPAPLKLIKVDGLGPDGAELMAVLDTTQLNKGDYSLVMRLRDKRTGVATIDRERQISLVP